MHYKVQYKSSIKKDLQRIGREEAEHILKKIREELALNPHQGIPLKGKRKSQLCRYRVGKYRVVYYLHDKELWILVVHIAHRKEVYRFI